MDDDTKDCLLQLIQDSSDAESILFEMGAFATEDGLSRMLARKRVAWLYRHGICGQELVTFYNTHGASVDSFCEEIDRQRGQEERQDVVSRINQLTLALTNDDTQLKYRLQAVRQYMNNDRDYLTHLDMLRKLGFQGFIKQLLEVSSPDVFVERLEEAYRNFSIQEQRFKNAERCSLHIIAIKLIKTTTLLHIKTLISAHLGNNKLHARGVITYTLTQQGWKGSLCDNLRNLYRHSWNWRRFIPSVDSPKGLCCYILLCDEQEINKMTMLFSVLNQR